MTDQQIFELFLDQTKAHAPVEYETILEFLLFRITANDLGLILALLITGGVIFSGMILFFPYALLAHLRELGVDEFQQEGGIPNQPRWL
jgi:hypothetical protein